MSLGLIVSGAVAAMLLAFGLNLVMPLGHAADALCLIGGVGSGTLFIGLADGV